MLFGVRTPATTKKRYLHHLYISFQQLSGYQLDTKLLPKKKKNLTQSGKLFVKSYLSQLENSKQKSGGLRLSLEPCIYHTLFISTELRRNKLNWRNSLSSKK